MRVPLISDTWHVVGRGTYFQHAFHLW